MDITSVWFIIQLFSVVILNITKVKNLLKNRGLFFFIEKVGGDPGSRGDVSPHQSTDAGQHDEVFVWLHQQLSEWKVRNRSKPHCTFLPQKPAGGGMSDRSLPMYVFAIVAQRSLYVAVSVPHSNSRHLFKLWKKSVESNIFPETLETGAFYCSMPWPRRMQRNTSSCSQHRWKMFWSINSFLLLPNFIWNIISVFSS